MLVEPPLQLNVRPLAGAEPGIMLGKYGAFSWFRPINSAETRPAATWVGQFFGCTQSRIASRSSSSAILVWSTRLCRKFCDWKEAFREPRGPAVCASRGTQAPEMPLQSWT